MQKNSLTCGKNRVYHPHLACTRAPLSPVFTGVAEPMAQLTAGAVNAMNNNNTGIKPTLQLIDVKKIQPANPHAMASDRYRLVISDGTQLMQAMLATNLNSMMDTGQVRCGASPRRRPSDQPPPLHRPLPKSHAAVHTEHSLCALGAAVAAAKVQHRPAGRVHLQHRAEPPHHHRPQPHRHPGLQRADWQPRSHR
jgi:hypothetical protein